ncbi:MAG: YcxB family protein [Lachnospiraceae bacterium]|nr:YcxB family protein [Lachnospiraceae bacterium]
MVEFDVHIKASDLYDYMMRHTYNSFSGILGSVLGALMVIAGVYMKGWLMVIAGIVLLCYLPWTLFLKSRQQMLANPAFKEPLHYVLDDEGIHVSQKDTEEMQQWENIVKAVSTGKSIIVYTSRMNACIFPKRDLGDKTALVIQVLSTHLPAKKVKIRQ